jgi:hypothetical protein
MSEEDSQKKRDEKYRSLFLLGLRAFRDREARHQYMQEMERILGRGIWLAVALGFLIYCVVGYYAIVILVEPPMISLYDFTAAQATALGVFVEGELISLGLFTFIVWLISRRFGRREKELKETLDRLNKTLEKMEKEKEGA